MKFNFHVDKVLHLGDPNINNTFDVEMKPGNYLVTVDKKDGEVSNITIVHEDYKNKSATATNVIRVDVDSGQIGMFTNRFIAETESYIINEYGVIAKTMDGDGEYAFIIYDDFKIVMNCYSK